MDTNSPIENDRPTAKRKPIWPWLVVFVVTLVVIYVHRRIVMIIDDLALLGRDLVQVFMWLASFFPDT